MTQNPKEPKMSKEPKVMPKKPKVPKDLKVPKEPKFPVHPMTQNLNEISKSKQWKNWKAPLEIP